MWNTEEIYKTGKPHFDHFCSKNGKILQRWRFWLILHYNCKFLDWLFIETRTCYKYLGVLILALSRTRDVFKLQQSCWMTHVEICHYWQQWTYLFLLGIRDKLYYFTSLERQGCLFFFFWCQDSIQRILYSQSFDTVKYLSDPNEGVILYVLPDFR